MNAIIDFLMGASLSTGPEWLGLMFMWGCLLYGAGLILSFFWEDGILPGVCMSVLIIPTAFIIGGILMTMVAFIGTFVIMIFS